MCSRSPGHLFQVFFFSPFWKVFKTAVLSRDTTTSLPFPCSSWQNVDLLLRSHLWQVWSAIGQRLGLAKSREYCIEDLWVKVKFQGRAAPWTDFGSLFSSEKVCRDHANRRSSMSQSGRYPRKRPLSVTRIVAGCNFLHLPLHPR